LQQDLREGVASAAALPRRIFHHHAKPPFADLFVSSLQRKLFQKQPLLTSTQLCASAIAVLTDGYTHHDAQL
jgi:hypothetical protein